MPDRGSQLSPADRLQGQLAYLTEDGPSITRVASQLGRTREVVSGCLRGGTFDQLKKNVRVADPLQHFSRTRGRLRRHGEDYFQVTSIPKKCAKTSRAGWFFGFGCGLLI